MISSNKINRTRVSSLTYGCAKVRIRSRDGVKVMIMVRISVSVRVRVRQALRQSAPNGSSYVAHFAL